MHFYLSYIFENQPLVKLFIRCISVGFIPIGDNSLHQGINSGILDTNSAPSIREGPREGAREGGKEGREGGGRNGGGSNREGV